MTPADQLRTAKAFIDKPQKWRKGPAYQGRLCALAALGRAEMATGTNIPCALLDRALPEGYGFVFALNDAPETTHADVMALFDRAIALAEEAQ